MPLGSQGARPNAPSIMFQAVTVNGLCLGKSGFCTTVDRLQWVIILCRSPPLHERLLWLNELPSAELHKCAGC